MRTFHHSNLLLCAVLPLLSLGWTTGCKEKTKTVVEENPELVSKLAVCEKTLLQKNEYIEMLEGGDGADGEEGEGVVVNIEGGGFNITAGVSKGPNSKGKTGDNAVRGNAKDAELYAGFVKALKRSRGSIKKCYQSALKKNSSLQARTVTLKINVSYKTSGDVSRSTFNPRVSEQFDSCMSNVAKKWKLPAMSSGVTFAYKQTLTPE